MTIETKDVNGTVVMFNNRKPDVYSIDDIYDPDKGDGSGKYIPSLYTLVIKNDGSLYYVSAVDSVTYKSTLKPVSFVAGSADDSESRIISYGNDKFCLYQDLRTDPHRLRVDAKFLVYGNSLKEYSLYRRNDDGDEECISLYFGADQRYYGNRIPLVSISESYAAYKYPTNCHTTTDLLEGETITLRVFDNNGNLAAEAVLYARNATWLNDLVGSVNPILKLDAECVQMQGDRFVIYTKQDPSHLNIKPYLLYADGIKEYLNIDNLQCFLYGLADFTPSYPGKTQTLIIKYFLNHKETAIDPTTVGNTQFLLCEKELVVVANANKYTVKLSIIPLWDGTHNTWRFRFFAYSDTRDVVHDVTDYCTLDPEYPIDGTPKSFGVEQHMVVNYSLQKVFNTDNELNATQHFWITLWNNGNYAKYTYRDSDDSDHIFGADGSVVRRPILWYDDAQIACFIPTSIFGNKEAVIESFYLLADPPYVALDETAPPTPTHFVIRDSTSGAQIIGGPIPLEEYGQAIHLIGNQGSLIGATVLVEFLREVSPNQLQILYGVPVDVVAGRYNTPDAPVPLKN